MTIHPLVLALAGLFATVSIAAAQPLPSWKIGEICAQESAPGQCATFEGEALRALSGSWAFILERVKQACVSQATAPADHSYRLLAECVDNGTLKVRESQAVMTAATPAEPVPLPKPEETEKSSGDTSSQAQPDTVQADGQKSETPAPAEAKQ